MMRATDRGVRTIVGIAAIAVLGGGLLAGCGKKQAGAGAGPGAGRRAGVGDPGGSIPVTVATVKNGTISQTIPVTGDIAALQDVQLAAKTAGRVIAVTAREGDVVHAGQLIVQQDATDLEANVRQDEANIQSALAAVAQAQDNYQIQVTQARQAVLQAQAQLAAAQQNYLKVKGGSRPQQKLQAKATVEQAKANLDNARINLERDKNLYAQGAIAKADLDTAQTTYDVDLQQYNNAKAAESLTLAGNQPEDIAYALEQVKQQKTNVRTQIANQQQISVRRSAIVAAQAAVQQARAKLAFDQQQVANAYIRSPINGIVASRETEPGQIASPGTVLMRIVNVKTVYYEPTISETDFGQISPGKPVTVTVDALPGRTFHGRIAEVYPAASASDRGFTLRVNIANSGNALRPGMFARGQIIAKTARNVPVIPATALVPVQEAAGLVANTSSDAPIAGGTQVPPRQVVVVGPGNKAEVRPVKVGIATMQSAEITSGLRAGEQIVVVGQQGLRSGDKLAIQNSGGAGNVNARSAQVP